MVRSHRVNPAWLERARGATEQVTPSSTSPVVDLWSVYRDRSSRHLALVPTPREPEPAEREETLLVVAAISRAFLRPIPLLSAVAAALAARAQGRSALTWGLVGLSLGPIGPLALIAVRHQGPEAVAVAQVVLPEAS